MPELKCPSCGFEFPLEEAFNDELQEALEREKQELRQQMLEYKKSKEEELRKKEEDFQRAKREQEDQFNNRLAEEIRKQSVHTEQNLRKTISADFENRIRLLQEAQQEQEKTVMKENEYLLRMKELEKQLEVQKKLAEEMKRKAEQGSMQLQGEVQELALEEMLRINFPYDEIVPVGKGMKGADCVQIIRTNLGQDCGRIIYECKRTEHFNEEWIEKLRVDMRSEGADIAVLVTRTLPKGMARFGSRQGVWVCSFEEARALPFVLREGIIRLYQATKSQQNKGDKMQLLYDYLSGNEFTEQWKAIREGFLSMRLSIQRERDAMEKLWKAREKQLEKVLLNAAHIHGSIEGIAGQDSIDFKLLEDIEGDNFLGD